MSYGLFQYYNDELAGWDRTVKVYKEESREMLLKISVVSDHETTFLAPDSNTFIEQCMSQQDELDHLADRIVGQQQRLDSFPLFSGNPVGQSICRQQDLLRTKIYTIGRDFIRTRYRWSNFIASILKDKESVPAFSINGGT